ncbi:DUF2510 domain-containing protein [Streptomyces sp. NPDC007851]|uniref:DUF2510 domain-containing protein n=1 Tax=Streptomyces sp. NPDC007851 TaxID=3155008 RepID=UPI003401E217
MTQVTPPGWYPDPGQTSDGPATERWWDGKAWTEQTRPAGSGADWGPPPQPPAAGAEAATGGAYPQADGAHPAYPAAYPGYPGYPAAPPASRRGLRTGIAVGIAAAVLAAIGVGVYVLTANDGNNDNQASQQGPGGQGGFGQGGTEGQNGQNGGQGFPFGGSGGSGGSGGGASPSPGQSEAPKIKSGSVTDAVSGISIPIPSGWYGQQTEAGASVTSNDSYKCPGETSQSCTAGGAYSAPAVLLGASGSTAEAVAKADIPASAKESYGGTTYGSITSHQVLAGRAVTVAGQKGYLVRWKVVTSKGADGYVESLAFPSPANSRQIVVVRFGVDVGQKESVIDSITAGIKVSTAGGSGQDT